MLDAFRDFSGARVRLAPAVCSQPGLCRPLVREREAAGGRTHVALLPSQPVASTAQADATCP